MSNHDTPAEGAPPATLSIQQLGRQWWRWTRVVLIAGIPVGFIVGGIGSRLAMFLLRLTSPNSVRGVESDDGFTIGRFTTSGTYNLLQLGATVGVIGAVAYLLVRPWLLGPPALRHVTVGLGSGAVVGSMLLHADGVDFALLKPRWFAMALFIGLPALFGVVIGVAVERAERLRVPLGWRQLIAPVVLLLIGPFSLFATLVLSPVILLYAGVRFYQAVDRSTDVELRPARCAAGQAVSVGRFAVRAVWLAIAVAGLVAVIGDIQEISALG